MREKLVPKDELVSYRDDRRLWRNIKPSLKTLSTNPSGGLRIRTWLIAILGFLLASLIIINTVITGQFRVSHLMNTTQDNYIDNEPLISPEAHKSGFLVRNKGCRIAALDPLDSFSKRFMKIEKPIECEFGSQGPLVESNDTHVFINPNVIRQYYNATENPNCCWREFRRKQNNDKYITMGDACHTFEASARVSAEFVRVECSRGGSPIYRDYHFFIPRKPEVELRCQRSPTAPPSTSPKLSVLILGLDSISRLNFRRMMPQTVKTLESLSAIEMLGYTKVGDNTYPNLVPVLTGLSDVELQAQCWNDSSKPYDDCPFIWKEFAAGGYRTVFAEDACSMTTFNYLKPGFRHQPTDYYLRPYCLASENDIGNTHKLNANLCVGTRKTFENLLGYTRKIVRAFPRDPYFAFFWEASLTHDFFNYPQLGDAAYSSAIQRFYEEGLMDNTALIVMSDHGMRWGEFRQTYQGRVEGSLPFVFVVLPKWWRSKNPRAVTNLRRNAGSLTTPFDLHETLKDLLQEETISEEGMRKRTHSMSGDELMQMPRGISWFLPIPGHRTCETAGIPGHWCMCHKSRDVEVDHEGVRNTTVFLIDELNGMVRRYPQCAELRVQKIMDAKVWSQAEEGSPWVDFTVTLETIPGHGVFEATIRRSTDGSKLVGSISRLNAYGTQSACVDDFNMRLYCYCA